MNPIRSIRFMTSSPLEHPGEKEHKTPRINQPKYYTGLQEKIFNFVHDWPRLNSATDDEAREIAIQASNLKKELDQHGQDLKSQADSLGTTIFTEIREDSDRLKNIIESFNRAHPEKPPIDSHPVQPPVVAKMSLLYILSCILYLFVSFWCGCCQKDDAVDEPRAALPQRTTPPAEAINPQGVAQ